MLLFGDDDVWAMTATRRNDDANNSNNSVRRNPGIFFMAVIKSSFSFCLLKNFLNFINFEKNKHFGKERIKNVSLGMTLFSLHNIYV